MHIAAFTPTRNVVLENDAVNATGVPQTELNLPPLRADQAHKITAPVLLCVWSEMGNDPNPCIYITVRDPDGETRGTFENMWLWDDIEGKQAKWRVFDLKVDFVLPKPGVYTFGVYNHPEDTEALAWYPLLINFDRQETP